MDNIIQRGLLDDFVCSFGTFDIFSNNLILAHKVPRNSYLILCKNITPRSLVNYGKTFLDDPSVHENLEWEEIRTKKFKMYN